MTTRVKSLIVFVLLLSVCSIWWAAPFPSGNWLRFAVYLVLVLLSSGLKVALPKGEGTAAVNFPLILLGVVQLSPCQTIAMAALSVLAQCRIRVLKPFTLMQIAFNVANTISATAMAYLTYFGFRRLHLELAPSLAIAASAYFLANTIPVAMAIGWSQGENPAQLWRREFPWYLPFYLVGAILAAVAHAVSLKFGWATSLLLIPLIYTTYRAYQSQIASVRTREKHLAETEALHVRTIEGLAMAIEAKDHGTHDHLVRVRTYVSEIGMALNLSKLELQALQTASFLHDIGKLAVPEHIINKPGKLTQEEFDKIKIHPVVGADILERVRFPYPVVPIVRSHHEAWDGSGYPDGLKGEEIPIGARILTVVDCFDALASDRPYRRALPTSEAMAFIKSKAGTQFDPNVVNILEQRYVELEDRARNASGSIEPLNTEISVERGEAPGAGFQEDNETKTAQPAAGASSLEAVKQVATPHESLSLIAAASHEAQAIFEMSQMLGGSLSPNEAISVMSARLRRLVPFDCFAVYLKRGDFLAAQYMDGEGAACFLPTPILLGDGLSGWVAQNGKTILNGNPKVETNYQPGSGAVKTLGAALSLPLHDLSGEIFGALTIYNAAPDSFSRDHLRILQAIESKFSLSLQNGLRYLNAEKDATIDFVTQLPNARQFFIGVEAEVNRAGACDGKLAVVVCGLNAFKEVNDYEGHLAGNLLLRAIAENFRHCCGPLDSLARTGGDEFVFLLADMDAQSCGARVEAIEQSVKKACREQKIGVSVSASVGAAYFPAEGTTAEELLGLADRRMYLHKRAMHEAGNGSSERKPIQMAKSA